MRLVLAGLFSTTALACPDMLWAAPAAAQEAPTPQAVPAAPAGSDQDIIVQGYRAQNAQAAQAKRDSLGVIDAVVADDVMALPDITLAETLRRIPGVSAEERNGDPQYVVIRGLAREYNSTTVDGAKLAGTDPDTESVQLSLLPSTLARRVDIRKTFSADMDGDVIGGAINVITRSAFDSPKTFFSAQVRGGQFEHRRAVGRTAEPSLDGSVTFAKSFLDERIGVVLSGTHRHAESFTYFPGVFSNGWDFYSDDLRRTSPDRYATGVNPDRPVPSGIRESVYTQEQDRNGVYGKLELRPTRRLSMSLSAFVFAEKSIEDRDDHYLYRTPAQGLSAVTETSGRVDRARLHVGNDYRIFRNRTDNVALTASYAFPDGQTLSVRANRSAGSQRNPQTEFRFQTDYLTGNAYTYDYAGAYPVFTLVNPATYTQPATAPLQHLRFFQFDNREVVRAAEGYFDDHFGRKDDGFGWRIGGAHRDTVRDRDYDMSEYQRATGVNLFLDRFQRDVDYTPETQQLTGQPMYLVDRNALLGYMSANPAQFRLTTAADQGIINDFRIEERVSAGYVTTSLRQGPLNLVAGLRYEDTALDSAGYQQLRRTGAAASVPYVRAEQAYDNWLPSALAEYDVAADTKLRAAVSRTVGRPNYSQVRVNGTRTIDSSRATVTLSAGNPELKAREATNYDLSLEYYPRRLDATFSLAVFRKDIANEIFTAIDTGVETIEGVEYTVTATQPRNALASRVTGVEAGVLLNNLGRFVRPLHGFGVKANVSYLKSEARVLMADGNPRDLYGLRGQPRTIANAEVFYAADGLELRAAYNHRGRYINAINTTRRFNDQFSDARNVIDLRARYAVTRQLRVFAEARNVTDFKQDETWDQDFGRIIYTRDDGRSYWLGLSFRY